MCVVYLSSIRYPSILSIGKIPLVSNLYPSCVTDLFSQIIRDSDFYSVNKIKVSFDIVSKFTNVSLQESLQVFTNSLFRSFSVLLVY